MDDMLTRLERIGTQWVGEAKKEILSEAGIIASAILVLAETLQETNTILQEIADQQKDPLRSLRTIPPPLNEIRTIFQKGNDRDLAKPNLSKETE